jgi:hypothetical protein
MMLHVYTRNGKYFVEFSINMDNFICYVYKKQVHEDINSYPWILFRYCVTVRDKIWGKSCYQSRPTAYILSLRRTKIVGLSLRRINGKQIENKTHEQFR